MFGRLGNSLFQYATLIALAEETDSDIYFQDLKWFEKYEDKIREMFNVGIGSIDKVAIHLRCTDYFQLEHQYPNLSKTDYYQKAIEHFPNAEFIIFSDDIPYCKKLPIFQDERFSFSEDKDEIQDFNLMASCKGIIMANSTFSFWASYLGDKDKKVVCPRDEMWGHKIGGIPTKWIRI
jgi:hypothetical protein